MKRIKRSTWAMLALPSLIACSTSGGDENLPTGQASFALSQTTGQGTFRFLGSIDIVSDGGAVTDTLVATESSPASQIKELPGGFYSLDIVDGDFGEKLVGSATPACSYSGGLTGFIGCTVGDPGFFLVSPGVTGDVVIPVTFHFGEGDVQILFSTGNAVFTLAATIVTEGCGDECTSGEICAAVDGNVGCYSSCGTCTLVAEEGGGNAQLICIGGSGGGECAHDSCEVGEALDPAVCGDCVANICAVDPFCCESSWDDICVGEVATVCGGTCDGGECAHDSCEVGEALDPAVCGDCVANICAVDPFCCESSWDDICVGEVATVCGATCGGGGECAHDQCEAGVALDPAVCGECVGNICAVDSFCCTNSWDDVCVGEVESICGATCGGGGECAHDQCEAGVALDPAVCGECVGNICAVDSFCCADCWDDVCVGEVGSICGVTCGAGGECAHDQCEAGVALDPAVCGECVGNICAV